MPLILPVHLVCNVPDELLNENVRTNSAVADRHWIYVRPPHERVALICGSGPSLGESLQELSSHLKPPPDDRLSDIFALNGAAAFLFEKGFLPDFQVLLDAREATADLIGPALMHLFASQVHPSCFERVPGAILWQVAIEGVDDLLPANHRERDYTLVGGGASVGITAMVLAWVLGYRKMHLFGYDSSYRGEERHAFKQPINEGEPSCCVTFNGKDYVTSLTMKLQAEKFRETAHLLEAEGCEIHLHGSGLLPDMWHAPVEQLSEQEKYERMWSIPAYRNESPGEHCVDKFVEVAHIADRGTITRVIDFGCGTGRAGIALQKAGCVPLLVDFASNCRDREAMCLPFYQFDLAEPMSFRAELGYCCDVMEHIPPDDVDNVLTNIFECVGEGAFFQISTVPDAFGAVINQRLHLSVFPHENWLGRLRKFGHVAYAVDSGNASIFYVVKQ